MVKKKIVESQFFEGHRKRNNSDRFSYDPQQEVEIPASIVDTVAELRKFGCFSPLPKAVIVNQHREFSANLEQISNSEDLKTLIKSLKKSLVLKNGEKMVLEDTRNRLVLDFYFQYPDVNIPFTVRSRLSQFGNKLDSHRVICVNARAKTERLQDAQREGKCLLLRKEEVLIARDNNEMTLPSLRAFSKRIDESNNGREAQPKAWITDIVLKRIYHFNAGEKTLWNHCGTYFLDRESKKRINSTEYFSLVGMVPYLSFCLQEVWQYRLTVKESRILTPRTWMEMLCPLIAKSRSLEDIFDSSKGFSGNGNHFFILEVEARGRENQERMFTAIEGVERITSLQPRLERKVNLLADRRHKIKRGENSAIQ